MNEPLADVRNQFLADAAEAMAAMAAKAAATASCYRRSRLAEGHEGLAALMNELRQFGALIAALRDTLGIGAAELAQGELSLDEQVARLAGWLEQLIAAHARQDWLSLADVLELDLEPLLRGWPPVLLACRTGTAAAAP